MKKLLLPLLMLLLVASASASTVIYKGSLTRKYDVEITSTREIKIDPSIHDIRIGVARTRGADEKRSEIPMFNVNVSTLANDTLLELIDANDIFNNFNFLLATPPHSIIISVGGGKGDYGIEVWGS